MGCSPWEAIDGSIIFRVVITTIVFLATDTELKFKENYLIFEAIMEPNVEIYTWSWCPFCIRAKALLNEKGVEFTEYCIDGDEVARADMAKRAHGRRSLPQIFINDQHIGGCDDMYDMEAQGKLDSLLQGGAATG
jgi:glutaredoxin 3